MSNKINQLYIAYVYIYESRKLRFFFLAVFEEKEAQNR